MSEETDEENEVVEDFFNWLQSKVHWGWTWWWATKLLWFFSDFLGLGKWDLLGVMIMLICYPIVWLFTGIGPALILLDLYLQPFRNWFGINAK
jgi:hypothetical protein